MTVQTEKIEGFASVGLTTVVANYIGGLQHLGLITEGDDDLDDIIFAQDWDDDEGYTFTVKVKPKK